MSKNLVNILAVVIAVTVLTTVIVSFVRRREITFEGQVIDKDIIENQMQNTSSTQGTGIHFGTNGGVTHSYRIKVKTDSGKELHYQISEGKYEIIKIGDRVSKGKGTTDVEIVQSAPGPTPTPPPDVLPTAPPPGPPAPTTFA